LVNEMTMKKYGVWMVAIAVAAGIVAGCNQIITASAQGVMGGPSTGPTGSTPGGGSASSFDPKVDAGWQVTAKDQKVLEELVKSYAGRFGSRNDPFALTAAERKYERDQSAERFLNEAGGFAVMFKEEQKVVVPKVVEPQPYRRLSGIVVGDSVVALIDMGNGDWELIRPGQMVGGTEWRVISIDEEKAVLRRPGNVLPNEVVVRLEAPPAGMGGFQGGQQSPPTGFNPGEGPTRGTPASGGGGAAGSAK
jgi:hypothetical protein